MSYAKKTFSGTLWNVLSNAGNQFVAFIVYVILARLFSIEEFGLIAFCFLILEFGNIFINFGLNQNLIQRQYWQDSFAKTCFWFLMAISVFVALIIALIIAPFSMLFYSSQSALLLVYLAIIPIINGFSLVSTAKLMREFRNKRLSVINITSTAFGGVVSVALAYSGYGVWSVIYGRILQSLTMTAMAYFSTEFRLSFYFNKNDLKELLAFGIPLIWLAVVKFFAERSMNFVVVFVLGNSAFAFIAVAQRGQQFLSAISISPVNKMLVPSFSRIADTNVTESYYRVIRATSIVVLPVFIGFAAVAEVFVALTFGEKWVLSGGLLTILCFTIIPNLLAWFLPSILISRAHTKAAYHLGLVTLFSHVTLSTAASYFGLYAVALSIPIAAVISLPIRFKITQRFIDIKLKESLHNIFAPVIASIIMFISVKMTGSILNWDNQFLVVELTAKIILGAIIYFSVLKIFFNKKLTESVKELKNIVGNK